MPNYENSLDNEMMPVLEGLANCRSKTEFEDNILPTICNLFGAKTAVMHYYAGDGGQSVYYDPIYINIKPQYLDKFRDRFSKMDPFPMAALQKTSNGEGYAFSSHQLVDMKQFEASEFYLYFLKPQNIYHMLIVVIMRGGKPFAFFGLHRDKDSKAFSQEEINRANILGPFLSAAADRVYIADELSLYKRALDTLSFGMMNKGLLILDSNLALVFANDYARTAFASRSEFNTEMRTLPEQIVTACQQLLEQGQALSTMSSVNFSLETRKPKISGYVRINEGGDGRQLFLAFFNSDEFGVLNPRVCEEFGLTKREIEITQCVIEGKTNSEVAEELFISVRTVQNHLRSIYEKCDVNNRTSLSNRVLSLI